MATNPHTPSSSWAQRSLVLLLIVFLGAGLYAYLERDVLRRWFAQDLIGKEMEILSDRIDHLKEELADARAEIELLSPSTPSEKVREVFGTDSGHVADVAQPEVQCAHLARRLQNLFDYLDSRAYIREAIGGVSSREYFRNVVTRTLKQPPVVAKETENILRVLQNSAHFFRTLGKNDTLLIAAFLRNEAELMEPTLGLIYELVGQEEQCRKEQVDISIPLGEAYQYAVYFLNTLGGRSYLLRRDSRVRMLSQYYSILVVDRANEKRLNEWGLDIRSPIDTLLTDIKSAANLARKKDYLKRLVELRDKYDQLYGG